MENDKTCATKTNCCCPCHRFAGILLLLIGVAFLLGAFDVLSQRAVSIIWPILVILIGLKKTIHCKCCSKA